MATIKVEIKNGKAVELNHLDKSLPAPIDVMSCGDVCACISFCLKYSWQQAEAARKVYEIEYKCCLGITPHIDNCGLCKDWKQYKEGSIHEAEKIDETTVKIIC